MYYTREYLDSLYSFISSLLSETHSFQNLTIDFYKEWINFILNPSIYETTIELNYPETIEEWWLEDDTLQIFHIWNEKVPLLHLTLNQWLHFLKKIYNQNIHLIEMTEEEDEENMVQEINDCLEIHQD